MAVIRLNESEFKGLITKCVRSVLNEYNTSNSGDEFYTRLSDIVDELSHYNFRGEIVYCNAGHNPPCILTHRGEVKPLPMSNDAMVGAVDGLEYTDATLQLDHGDTLFMYTDGVTEALDKDNGEFGEQRMQTTLAGAAGQDCQSMVESMKTAVAAFAGEAEQSDDITVMALKRL